MKKKENKLNYNIFPAENENENEKHRFQYSVWPSVGPKFLLVPLYETS
jgi:hypothetical protein